MTIRFRCRCGRKFEVPDSVAGRKAQCTDCGLTFLVPSPNAQPAAAQAAGHQAHRPSPRPASPPPHRPAVPPAHRPEAPQAPYALVDHDDYVPMARLAPRPAHQRPHAHLGSRRPRLIPVQLVAGISGVVALAVIVDSLSTMLDARRAGLHGLELVYGLAVLFVGIGVIVSLAASSGNRFCIGMMLGGAVRNVLNAPVLFFLATSKIQFVTSQGPDAAAICRVAGAISLITGVGYFLAPFLSKAVRGYMGANYGAVIGGAAVGLLLGPLVVCTALPAPELVWVRSITARRDQPGVIASLAKPASPAESLVAAATAAKQQVDNRIAMLEQMTVIQEAMSEYLRDHSKLPANLGLLVSDSCPVKLFACPTKGAADMPRRDPEGGYFMTRTDVVYVFMQGHRASQLESIPNAAELIVAYSDPTCGLGDGVLVMRLPNIAASPVEWVDKATFERQMTATKKWLEDNQWRETPPGLPE